MLKLSHSIRREPEATEALDLEDDVTCVDREPVGRHENGDCQVAVLKSVLTFDLGRRLRRFWRRQGLGFALHSLLEQRLLLGIVVVGGNAVCDL